MAKRLSKAAQADLVAQTNSQDTGAGDGDAGKLARMLDATTAECKLALAMLATILASGAYAVILATNYTSSRAMQSQGSRAAAWCKAKFRIYRADTARAVSCALAWMACEDTSSEGEPVNLAKLGPAPCNMGSQFVRSSDTTYNPCSTAYVSTAGSDGYHVASSETGGGMSGRGFATALDATCLHFGDAACPSGLPLARMRDGRSKGPGGRLVALVAEDSTFQALAFLVTAIRVDAASPTGPAMVRACKGAATQILANRDAYLAAVATGRAGDDNDTMAAWPVANGSLL